MKSTLKIAFQSNMRPELPVIKIVQPIDQKNGKFDPSEDNDVKDELLHAFLTKPASKDYYPFFTVKSSFPHPSENPTHWITTIQPVQVQDVLYKIRHMVLNRFVHSDSIVSMNGMIENEYHSNEIPNDLVLENGGVENYKKIHEFFNWIDTLNYAPE